MESHNGPNLHFAGELVYYSEESHTNEEEKDLELPLLDLATVLKATNNFSMENKLGEGGFGLVYKVRICFFSLLFFIFFYFIYFYGEAKPTKLLDFSLEMIT